MSNEMINDFDSIKKLAEKIDKNSFWEIYVPNVFYYYSQEKIDKMTKAGRKAMKKLKKLMKSI